MRFKVCLWYDAMTKVNDSLLTSTLSDLSNCLKYSDYFTIKFIVKLIEELKLSLLIFNPFF